ncbi:TadE/TadG family type IV pilus assembly protein [Embleya sp. NPDC050493]|uniref:TadE/TadG family type IV pilus assembly protein n=1 Tax=Embleya sp. NPDC050493 TaxID=3363989 RepID=UPI0037A0A311
MNKVPRGFPADAIRRRLRKAGGSDRGGMSITMAIIFPVFILVLLAVIQGCLWWYAREVAMQAAKEGVEEGRHKGGNIGDAEKRSRDVAKDLSGGMLKDLKVTPERVDGSRLKVTVEGTSLSIVPGIGSLTITQHADGVVERWTTAGR